MAEELPEADERGRGVLMYVLSRVYLHASS